MFVQELSQDECLCVSQKYMTKAKANSKAYYTLPFSPDNRRVMRHTHTQILMVPSDCPCLSTILVFLANLYNVSAILHWAAVLQ